MPTEPSSPDRGGLGLLAVLILLSASPAWALPDSGLEPVPSPPPAAPLTGRPPLVLQPTVPRSARATRIAAPVPTPAAEIESSAARGLPPGPIPTGALPDPAAKGEAILGTASTRATRTRPVSAKSTKAATKTVAPAKIAVAAVPTAAAAEAAKAALPAAAQAVVAAAAPASPLAVAAPSGPPSEAQQYCSSIAGAAIDAQAAWQATRLIELDQQLKTRIAELEAKRTEYKDWLARREDALKKAEDGLVAIYSRMRPDAAALQLAAMEDGTAAAVIAKLNSRTASAILNEMEAGRAARLTGTMTGLQPGARDGKKL